MQELSKRGLCGFACLLILAGSILTSSSIHAATVVINNTDGAGEGFNDPTPFTPVGGNTATTLGQARLNAFQFAADIWASCLESSVTITIDAAFDPLTCTATSAVLGSAGANTVHGNFGAVAPYPPELTDTWYPQALANAMDGADLDTTESDATATFNSSVNGNAACLGGQNWYYGFDRSPPGSNVDFVTVLLHELGHSLGFSTFVSRTDGSFLGGFQDTYLNNMEQHGATPSALTAMTDAQRLASFTSGPNLHWVGPQVTALAGGFSAGVSGGHVQLFAPGTLQPGSSLSHFDSALTPNETMEPQYTAPTHEIGLAFELMQDIGWRLEGQDLWGRDEIMDDGTEPNPSSAAMWRSPDIWVRQSQDSVSGTRDTGPIYANEHVHQDAEFMTTGPNYVYVKVRNRACRNSLGETAKLKLYFAKAGTGLSWDADWVNSVVGGVTYGDEIATVDIPPIPRGREWVAEIPWNVPDPADFASFGSDQNHFCLLARVETDTASPFGMTTPEVVNVNTNTQANNNIWWKNVRIYDLNPSNLVFTSNILIGSAKVREGLYDLRFRALGEGQDFFKRGRLHVDLGELQGRWAQNGGEGKGIRRSRDGKRILIDPGVNEARVMGIPLRDGEQHMVTLRFDLEQGPDKPQNVAYEVAQFAAGNREPDGGVTLEVRWDPKSKKGGNPPGIQPPKDGQPPGSGDNQPNPDVKKWWWVILLAILVLLLLGWILRKK